MSGVTDLTKKFIHSSKFASPEKWVRFKSGKLAQVESSKIANFKNRHQFTVGKTKNDGNLQIGKNIRKNPPWEFLKSLNVKSDSKRCRSFSKDPNAFFFLRIHVGLSGETGHQLKHASKS